LSDPKQVVRVPRLFIPVAGEGGQEFEKPTYRSRSSSERRWPVQRRISCCVRAVMVQPLYSALKYSDIRSLAIALLASGCALNAQTLKGVVDIHVHSDPDSRPRSIDAIDAIRLAQQRGFRAAVLKNHYESTASQGYLVRKVVPGIEVFGGIALNLAVGGINAAAVERMPSVKGGYGRVVWMPTFDAENQIKYRKESRPFVSITRNGELLPEVKQMLTIIAKHKLVLATGHSSPAECLALIREARKAGVE
jgi:hypothetical protein